VKNHEYKLCGCVRAINGHCMSCSGFPEQHTRESLLNEFKWLEEAMPAHRGLPALRAALDKLDRVPEGGG